MRWLLLLMPLALACSVDGLGEQQVIIPTLAVDDLY
mgnify:CR=1 FL=1|jgi:hypothetical protein